MFRAIFSLIIRSILAVNYSFWFYSCVSLSAAVSSRQRHTWIKPEAVITIKIIPIMSENIARNMQSSQGTINYPTQLHFVGHFCKKFVNIMMLLVHEWSAVKTKVIKRKLRSGFNGLALRRVPSIPPRKGVKVPESTRKHFGLLWRLCHR